MVDFVVTNSGVECHYIADRFSNNEWVWAELKQHSKVRISRIFNFKLSDLVSQPSPDEDFDDYVYHFQFGTFSGDYVKIPARIFNIKNHLLISRTITLRRSIFAAERNISIFGCLSKLLDHTNPIVIGGIAPNAIPWPVFDELLKKFPTTIEVNRYANARVHTILSQYLDGMSDARGSYEAYLKRKATHNISYLDLDVIKKLEVEKYLLIRELIKDALHNK